MYSDILKAVIKEIEFEEEINEINTEIETELNYYSVDVRRIEKNGA